MPTKGVFALSRGHSGDKAQGAGPSFAEEPCRPQPSISEVAESETLSPEWQNPWVSMNRIVASATPWAAAMAGGKVKPGVKVAKDEKHQAGTA
jgi:hypothetical protein